MPALALAVGALFPAVVSPSAGQVDRLVTLVQQDSNDARNHLALGLALLERSKYDRAEASLRAAIALDPRLADAHLTLSLLPYARRPQLGLEERRGRVPASWRDRLDDAHKMYRRAFVLDPLVNLRALSILFPTGSWKSRDYTSEESKFYELFVEGFTSLSSGRNRDAFELLDQLAKRVFFAERNLDEVPEFVLWARGMAAARIRDDSAAIRDFRTLLERALKVEQRPQLVAVPLRTNEYRYILGVLHERSGDTVRAVELLQEAGAADLGLDMAHVRLAQIHRARKDFTGEMVERQRAVQSNPEDATLLLELALLRFEAGQLEEAEQDLTHAAELAPRNPRPLYLLGVILQGQQRNEEARAVFQRCVAVAPRREAAIARDAQTRMELLK